MIKVNVPFSLKIYKLNSVGSIEKPNMAETPSPRSATMRRYYSDPEFRASFIARATNHLKQRRANDPEYDASFKERLRVNAQKWASFPDNAEAKRQYNRERNRRIREEKRKAQEMQLLPITITSPVAETIVAVTMKRT